MISRKSHQIAPESVSQAARVPEEELPPRDNPRDRCLVGMLAAMREVVSQTRQTVAPAPLRRPAPGPREGPWPSLQRTWVRCSA
jgi:hypothetical protein